MKCRDIFYMRNDLDLTVNESDPHSDVHYLGSSEKKA